MSSGIFSQQTTIDARLYISLDHCIPYHIHHRILYLIRMCSVLVIYTRKSIVHWNDCHTVKDPENKVVVFEIWVFSPKVLFNCHCMSKTQKESCAIFCQRSPFSTVIPRVSFSSFAIAFWFASCSELSYSADRLNGPLHTY